MKRNKTTPFYFDNTEAWGTDAFFALGILGFFLYVLLGLTSLPSVGGTLSWREFSFVQVRAQLEMCSPLSACVSVGVCVLVFTFQPIDVISHVLIINKKASFRAFMIIYTWSVQVFIRVIKVL